MPNPGSAAAYARALVPWLVYCTRGGVDPAAGSVDPAAATAWDARGYLASLAGKAPGTQAMYCAVARSFYQVAIDERIAAVNPFYRVRPRSSAPVEPTPALTEDEWERVLDAIEADAGRFGGRRILVCGRDFAVVYVAGRVGLRRIELVRMTWGDIRPRTAGTTLRVRGKADKRRPSDCPTTSPCASRDGERSVHKRWGAGSARRSRSSRLSG